MIIKRLQGGLPSFLFPQNAMCGGAPLVSHRHRPADDGSRLVRHTEEVRIECAQQGGERRAIIASCKAIAKKHIHETSRSCVLTDIMWRSAL